MDEMAKSSPFQGGDWGFNPLWEYQHMQEMVCLVAREIVILLDRVQIPISWPIWVRGVVGRSRMVEAH